MEETTYITIVVPTLLVPPKELFQYSLDQYNDSDLVKKIVVIDNTDTKDFDKQYKITEKFLVIKPPTNLGASVNEGMKYCDTKYYLQVNDDIICHKSILKDCCNIMESDDQIGLLQIETINNQSLSEYLDVFDKLEEQPIKYETVERHKTVGWFQFGRKENWFDIPTELTTFGGDDLILLSMGHLGLKAVKLKSKHISHMKATTVNSIGKNMYKIKKEEVEIYREYKKTLGDMLK